MKEMALQQAVQEFVRSFGLLDQSTTPCGRPLPASQAHALQVLGEEGALPQQSLADRLGLEKSTVSRMVSDMVGRGWVDRAPNPANRREVRLSLTEAGSSMLDQILVAADSRCQAIWRRIPAEKQAQVLETLQLLARATRKE
ncbi:MAG TPA: MarR family transcriptional regulator [Symbiobacteriaceae bacterium]|jgi:DNA-binding MarR family transcriptional regulator|nr:MarR family transcriptional regulator [Symbiobacteriaceae bacterium]